jgi:Rieske Fe-S protein
MDASLQDNGRRTWIKALLGTGFASSIISFLYPAVRFMLPPPVAESSANEVPAGKTTDLTPNSGRIFKFGSRPGLLIRTEAGEWRAFSAVCTHLNCTVQYRPDTQQIWCACHNGLYDLNGKVIGGPPPRPLEQYVVNIRNDEVVVSRRT